MDTSEYFELIDKCAETRRNLIIHNGERQHAAYLLKTFFKNAKSNIRIFTGQLFEGVFGDQSLQEEACKFLREDDSHSIQIAYQERADILKSTFIQTILNDQQRKGSIAIWNASEKYSDCKNHFAVMDEEAFRFETDHDFTRAVANFGDPAYARKLIDIFDNIAKNSSAIL